MRLLQCFSSRPISTGMSSSHHHLVDPSAPSAALPEPQHRHDDSSFASLSSPRICAPSNRQPLSEPTAAGNPHSKNPQVSASCSAAPAPNTAPSKFVPTSIPDLHPEYAHAEPYCFVARTESARIVVDRMRGARGQPAMDHAHILRQQGVKVVRGPSYPATRALELMNSQSSPSQSDAQGAIVDKENERNENKDIPNQQQNRQGDDGDEIVKPDTSSVNMNQKDVNARKKNNKDKASSVRRPSVPLRVEMPTSLGNDGGHSSGDDGGNGDRGDGKGTPVTSPSYKSRKSLIDLRRKSNKSISKKHASGTSRRRGTLTSNNNKTERVEILSEHVEHNTYDEDRPLNKQQVDTSVPLNEPVNTLDGADSIRPPPTPMEHGSLSSFDKLIEKHMNNTPSELLAPIVVPRTSVVHDSKHVLSVASPRSNNKHNSKVPTQSETSSQRYADAETDMDMDFYSGLLSSAGIGQSSSNTATSKPVSQLPATDVDLATGGNSIGSLAAMAETAASPSHALRERRKSKPLLTAVSVPSLDSGAAAVPHNNSPSLTSFSTPPRPSLKATNKGLSSPLKSSLKPKPNTTKSSMPMPPSNPLDKSSTASATPTLYDGHDMDMSITGDRAEAMNQQHKYKQSPKHLIAAPPSALSSSSNANNTNASENNKRHVNPIDIPRAAAMPPAIGQRPSANRNRKTVSFHDAAPVIIEPNLRAPSRSLPRPSKDEGGSGLGGRTLDSRGRNNGGAGNAPPTIGSVLSKARDSVTGKNMPMMIPLIDVDDSEDEDESRDGESGSDSNTIDIELRRSQAMPDRDRRLSRTLQQYMDSGSASDSVDVTHISFNARANRNSKTTITSPNKSMRHQSPTNNSRNISTAKTNVSVPEYTPERPTPSSTLSKTSPHQSPSSSSSSLYTDALSSTLPTERMSNTNANPNIDHHRANNNQTYNNNARKPHGAASGTAMPDRGRTTTTRANVPTMTSATRSTPQHVTEESGSDSVEVTSLRTLSANGRKSLGSGMPDRERTSQSRSTSLFPSAGYTDGSASDSVDMTMSNKSSSLSDQRQQPLHQRRNTTTTSTSMTGTASPRAVTGNVSARGGGVQHPMREREHSDVSNRSLDNSSSMDDLSSSWTRNRSSRRVSSRDKAAIREATKRQSIAVAQAMSEQIRGVPRSAMLAYSQNEVIIEDDEVADDEATITTEDGGWSEPGSMGDMSSTSGANSSFTNNNPRGSYSAERRMSRASKVIHLPTFKPGEVPTPPPPPPFLPRRLNVRSVRMPPPPPTAHLFAKK